MAANQREYGDEYATLQFVSPATAVAAAQRRAGLLAGLAAHAQLGCRGTKLDCRNLSPGCRACVAGTWSCLFVNGQCNCRCFYCPTPQDELGVPMTQTLTFASAADYAEYVERFGYTGVSMSGGEPLLTLDRCLSHLAAVRRRGGDRLHTWLYTNGALLTADIVGQLVDVGLDEIRFDIGARALDLSRIPLAAGRIPVVTVEIPAVPEEADTLRGLLPRLADLGVAHLNLHQLRLTPHNLPHLRRRGYTFLHGPRVTVLESELAALEVMADGFAQGVPLPVNYCSFAYKNRYQAAGNRTRCGLLARRAPEELTANGFLRRLRLCGPAQRLAPQAARLAPGADLSPERTELALPLAALSQVDWEGCRLSVDYLAAHAVPRLSYRHPFIEVELASGTSLYLERRAADGRMDLDATQAAAFAAALTAAYAPAKRPEADSAGEPGQAYWVGSGRDLASVAGRGAAAADGSVDRSPEVGAAQVAAVLAPVARYEFVEAGLPEYY